MLLHELLLLRVFFYFFIFFIVAGNQRRRRRKKKNKDGEPDSQEEGKPDQEKVELHFEDVEEFPVLSSAKGISLSVLMLHNLCLVVVE